MDTLIKGGLVVTSEDQYHADVYLNQSRIEHIGSLQDVDAANVVDATGKLVLPGGVDPHTHMDVPFAGTNSSDTFETGTVAAAIGGTTTIIDFPIQKQGDDVRVSLEEWFAKAEGRASVDWGFHQIVTDMPESALGSLDALGEEGITSVKLFMAYPGALMVDDATIFRTLRHSANTGTFVMVHAENGGVLEVLIEEAVKEGKIAPEYHGSTHPSSAEGEAAHRAIALADVADAPLYIVHLSSAEGLREVERGRNDGKRVYAESCPHYLLLDEHKMEQPGFEGAKFVVSPPLRREADQSALWGGLQRGSLQVISTDHSSYCFHGSKDLGLSDFSKIPPGLPGVEWRLGLLYENGVKAGRISLSELVAATATNPAKLFGLYPKKGDIRVGSDADVVIFNPDGFSDISAATMATSCDYTPYEGWRVQGRVETVYLRGKPIVEAGKFIGSSGGGRFLRRGEPSLPS